MEPGVDGKERETIPGKIFRGVAWRRLAQSGAEVQSGFSCPAVSSWRKGCLSLHTGAVGRWAEPSIQCKDTELVFMLSAC